MPGWLLATGPAGGVATRCAESLLDIWLLLGYGLAPASILLSPLFAWGAVVWWGVAVTGLALTLQLRTTV